MENLNTIWVVADCFSDTIIYCSTSYKDANSRFKFECNSWVNTWIKSLSDLLSISPDSVNIKRDFKSVYNQDLPCAPFRLLRYNLARHYLVDALSAANNSLRDDFRRFLEFAFSSSNKEVVK